MVHVLMFLLLSQPKPLEPKPADVKPPVEVKTAPAPMAPDVKAHQRRLGRVRSGQAQLHRCG